MTRPVSTSLNLSDLPYPDSLTPPEYETIRSERMASLKKRFEDDGVPFDVERLEAEPASKLQREDGFRELLDRERMIELAKENTVAFAGPDGLAHLGALMGPKRFLIDAGDPDASPPRSPVYEDIEDYRLRIMEAPEAYPYAGLTGGAYRQIALEAAAGKLKDVRVNKRWDSKGHPVMTVVLLARDAYRDRQAEILVAVRAAFADEGATQLTDIVTVRMARDLAYRLDIVLEVPRGPDPALICAVAKTALVTTTAELHRIGERLPLDALYKAARVGNVKKVHINLMEDITPAADEAAFAASIEVRAEIVR